MLIEDITMTSTGTFASSTEIHRDEFFGERSQSQTYTFMGVSRQVRVSEGRLEIENLNIKKKYSLSIEGLNLRGIFSEDHRFWIMPYNTGVFYVWAFSRANNNLAELFLGEDSQVTAYKYISTSNVPYLVLTLMYGDKDGHISYKDIYLNLYTMKLVDRTEFFKSH